MKKYEWIKQESDAEIYEVNGQYIKVVWGYSKGNDTGWHNEFDTDVCVYRWTGEECEVDELPGAMDSDWEAVEGFDFEVDDDGEVDGVLLDSMWEAYAKNVDEILAQIEKEVNEMKKNEIIKQEAKEIEKAFAFAAGKKLHVCKEDIIFTDTVPGEKCNNGGEYGFYTRYSPIPGHPGIYRVYTETTCDFDACGTGYEGIHALTTDEYQRLKKASDKIEAAGSLY